MNEPKPIGKEIKLRSFSVELETFGSKKGQYECKARFSHGKNSFVLHLDNELGDKLVQLCKLEIAKSSQQALEMLTIATKGES